MIKWLKPEVTPAESEMNRTEQNRTELNWTANTARDAQLICLARGFTQDQLEELNFVTNWIATIVAYCWILKGDTKSPSNFHRISSTQKLNQILTLKIKSIRIMSLENHD